MTNDTVEKLRAAKALIDTPEKWTKGTLARDSIGISVLVRSDDAVCFCVLGALGRAATETGPHVWAIRDSLPAPYLAVSKFNDDPTTTHADVMALFDRAIARAGREAI